MDDNLLLVYTRIVRLLYSWLFPLNEDEISKQLCPSLHEHCGKAWMSIDVIQSFECKTIPFFSPLYIF